MTQTDFRIEHYAEGAQYMYSDPESEITLSMDKFKKLGNWANKQIDSENSAD